MEYSRRSLPRRVSRKIDAQFNAVLDAVAAAPPPQSVAGQVGAMHGTMGGYYEIRITGPGREQFRLFCLLENATPTELRRRGLKAPSIVLINGMRSPTERSSPTATTASQSLARSTSPTHPTTCSLTLPLVLIAYLILWLLVCLLLGAGVWKSALPLLGSFSASAILRAGVLGLDFLVAMGVA